MMRIGHVRVLVDHALVAMSVGVGLAVGISGCVIVPVVGIVCVLVRVLQR